MLFQACRSPFGCKRACVWAPCRRLTNLLEIWFLIVGIKMNFQYLCARTGSLTIAETQPKRCSFFQWIFPECLTSNRSWRSCSVVSNSLQPCELKPSRLFCPWDSSGKNTGVGFHALLQKIFLTQELSPLLLQSPALAGGFFITSATWEAHWKTGDREVETKIGTNNTWTSTHGLRSVCSRTG